MSLQYLFSHPTLTLLQNTDYQRVQNEYTLFEIYLSIVGYRMVK
jgi:hypothetical protein